jgi:hypothetical protein
MVVGDLDPMLGGKAFKGVLGLECLGRSLIGCHEVDVLESREMVNKDGGILVASLGETALGLAKEARLCRLEVVNGDTPPGLVAVKTECWAFYSLPCQATFVMAPKRQPAYLRGRILVSFLGISPLRARRRSFLKEA